MDAIIMAKSTFIQRAFVFRLDIRDVKKNTGLFDLEKFFRDMASRSGVAYRDPCCDSQTGFPTRLAQDLGSYEYFDPADQTWKTSPV